MRSECRCSPARFGATHRGSFCYPGGRSLYSLSREQFSQPAAESLFHKLEELSQRSGVSRGVAFEDWLVAIACALAAETKEAEYLAMIARHTQGPAGRRGCDLMAQMFGELVHAMDQSDADLLGDLFVGAISYGEAGQYFTPESIARMLAQMTIDPAARPEPGKPIYVHDPCCGSGRMLLEAAQINPHVKLVGMDVDSRCARIAAINLGLRGRYGWIMCGNSLSGQTSFAYRNGSFFHESPRGLRRGVIRDVPPEATPLPVIEGRTRSQAHDLFAEKPVDAPLVASPPTIIEVPRWLARVEPLLATSDAEVSPSTTQVEPIDASEPEQHIAVTPPALKSTDVTQRRLF